MKVSELEYAKRRALDIFDDWLDNTGVVVRHNSYYDELCGIIEDAVHCGAQAAVGVNEKLDSEK